MSAPLEPATRVVGNPVSPKVTAATAAAALVTLLIYGFDLGGVEFPAEVAGPLTALLVFAAGYVKRDPARVVSG